MIAIVNYGLGNIAAFANILNQHNHEFNIVTDADGLMDASKIILPGVGHFDFAMKKLHESGMRSALDQKKSEGCPILGVCVGMQILGASSEEGMYAGLNYIPGTVKKLDFGHNKILAYTHMGWNAVECDKYGLFEGLDDFPEFYFLHSYYFETSNSVNTLAVTQYGQKFACAVQNGNVFGVQFHPEKSHQNGEKLILNFLKNIKQVFTQDCSFVANPK